MYLTLSDIMEIALTKMSSKGQIVIPSELRENMKEGEQLIIIKNDHQFILKKTSEMDKNLKEDIEFAKRTEAARTKGNVAFHLTRVLEQYCDQLKQYYITINDSEKLKLLTDFQSFVNGYAGLEAKVNDCTKEEKSAPPRP